jgi:hypothetical protein
MELGKSVNQAGMAAFKPENTYAHPIAGAFASACGYDAEGKVVSPNSPKSDGPHTPDGAPDWRPADR